MIRTFFSLSAADCSAVRMTFELFGRTSTSGGRYDVDRFEDVCRRGIHRLPSLDDARRSEALEEAAVPATRAHGYEPCLESRDRTDEPPSSRSSRCAVWWCMFAISTPSTTPTAVPSARAWPGSSVCTCTLSADGSPTTRSESPIRSSSLSSTSLSSPSPSIDEDGAVAELRRAPGGWRRSRATPSRRSVRERLPGGAVDHATRDLDEPGAACVDHTRVRAARRASRVCATARPRRVRRRHARARAGGDADAPSARSPRHLADHR